MLILGLFILVVYVQGDCTEGADACDSHLAPRVETAVFAAGCFWEVEHVFGELHGVVDAVSGFMGGEVEFPTYKQVYTDSTGHAEVVKIDFQPDVITYDQLLDTYWKAHDPTQLNRQGIDIGTRYRTEIFYMDDDQKKAAEESLANAMPMFDNKIVTKITQASRFYPAEDYHQDYFKKHPEERE